MEGRHKRRVIKYSFFDFGFLICVVSSFHSLARERTASYIIGRRWRLLQVFFAVVEESLLLRMPEPIDGLLVVHLHIFAESDQLDDGLASF
jgi:hypothetical protein